MTTTRTATATYDILVCADCSYVAHNGIDAYFVPGDDTVTPLSRLSGVDILGALDDRVSFSRNECGGCGSIYAGHRVALTVRETIRA